MARMDDAMVAWLTAQLDADERAASAATPGPWAYDPTRGFRMPGGDPLEFVSTGAGGSVRGIAATGPADDPQSMADAGHIARHDPEHVLADVEAKRKIIKRYPQGDVIRLLAAGYQDRPGYQADWATS